jgi:hypothetical protein
VNNEYINVFVAAVLNDISILEREVLTWQSLECLRYMVLFRIHVFEIKLFHQNYFTWDTRPLVILFVILQHVTKVMCKI